MCDLPDGSNKAHPTTKRDPRTLRRVVSFVRIFELSGYKQDNRAEQTVKQIALYSGRCGFRVPLLSKGGLLEKQILKTLVFSISKNSTGYPPLDVMTEGYKRVSF